MQSSARNQLSEDYMSPNNTAFTYLNSTIPEGQNVSGWNMGESSSSAAQSLLDNNAQKPELVWAPSIIGSSGVVPVRQNEPASVFSLNAVSLSSSQIAHGPVLLQSSGSLSQDLNINAGFGEQGSDDCQIVERPNIFKSSSSENARLPSSNSSSNPYGLHVSGYVEDRDQRPGNSLAGRHLSRKRKAMDGNIGQSSGSGTSNYLQHAEGSAWHAVPDRQNASNSLSFSLPSESAIGTSQLEQLNPGFGMGLGVISPDIPPAVSATGTSESSHRNLRLRFSSSHQLDSLPTNVFAAVPVGPVNYLSPNQPLMTPLNSHLDMLSPAVTGGGILPRQSILAHVPAMRPNMQSSRWNRNSNSRPGSSSSIAVAGDNRDVASHEEARSRSMQRNILEHPMFIPSGMIDAAQSQSNWGLTSGNSIAGNVASFSHRGPTSGANSTSAPNAVRNRNSPQYSRRLSELVRRSLLSSSGPQSGGQISNTSPGTPASAQGMAIPSGDQGHGLPQSRPATLLDRRFDGAFGIPYSLRTLATAASEGRSRLASEIRNVLAQMRRGEGLRFEDVMLLDQSVLFGMGHHDRHSDMRLDIDNMSYEELLALEDRIGYVNTGLSEEATLKCLKKRKYAATKTNPKESEPCCICQEEYVKGDELGKLKCGHDFHTACIKQWLTHKNVCPICKTTNMDTKEKQ